MYKIEMHAHTSEISRCSRVPAKQMIEAYAGAGYTGLVVTDHFSTDYFEHIPPAREEASAHLEGWRAAKRAGEKWGVRVYLGSEIRFEGDPSDFLIYGADEEQFLQIAAVPGLFQMGPEKFHDFLRGTGILLFQAHPFRDHMKRAVPSALDGVEVGNFNPRHHSRNELALAFAAENGLLCSTGSDYHQPEDLAGGGICCERLPEDEKDLCRILRSGNYTLIGAEKIGTGTEKA